MRQPAIGSMATAIVAAGRGKHHTPMASERWYYYRVRMVNGTWEYCEKRLSVEGY